MTRIVTVLCFLFSVSILSAKDYRTERVKQLELIAFNLNNNHRYEDTYSVLHHFLQLESLSPEEEYYGYLYTSFVYKRLFDYEKVHFFLNKAESVIPTTKDKNHFKINLGCQRSFAFFDTQNFDTSHAIMKSLEPFVDDELPHEERSFFYMQLGYIDYLNENYSSAIQLLQKSEQIMLDNEPRHLPIVYIKLMEVSAALEKFGLLEEYFDKSLKSATDSGIDKYRILTFQVRRDIAERSGDFDAYLVYDQLFDQAENDYSAKQHLIEVQEKEHFYQEQLIQLKIKEKKAENRRLIFLLIGVILVLLLVSVLWRRVFHLNRKLKVQNISLEKMDQLNKEIFSVISHDFKEQLLSISAGLNLFSGNNSGLKLHLENIKEQIVGTRKVLNELLVWAARELKFNGVKTVSPSEEDTLNEVVNSLKKQALNKGIQVNVQLKHELKLPLDKWVFNIVLRNLLSNALKFSHPNSQVIVICEKDNISVVDFGVGVSGDVLQQKFEKRQDPGYGTSGESGFGIGLYLCKTLLARNGYQLKVSLNEPTGSTFKILPET